ncbi:unnamed protein product [Phytophthora fragariaefolia]|uniref:Unnamed protein product n=1 Tax=Phytophthora fragariaefolia TaxID=1490495 RepID=A0A9W7D5Q6_9STRA|nr:unnamed protein product [Phytophthora fragariaefolia]
MSIVTDLATPSVTDGRYAHAAHTPSVTDGRYAHAAYLPYAHAAYLPSVTLGIAKSVADSNGLVAAREIGVTNLIIAGSSHIDYPDSANGYKAKQLPAEFAFGSTGIPNLNFVRYIHVARQYNSAAQAMVVEALDNMAGRVVLSGKRKAELKLLNRIPEVLQSVGKLGNSANESGMMAGPPAGPETIDNVSNRVHKPGQDSTKVGNSAEAVPLMVSSRTDVPEKNETSSGIFAVVGELWGILLPQSRVHRPGARSSRAHQVCVDDGSTEQSANCLSMVIKAAPMVTDFAHGTKEDKPNDNPKGARTAELSWNIPDKWLLHLAELRTPATICVDPLVARVSRRLHAQDAQEEKSSWSTPETYTRNEPDQESQRQVHDIEKTVTTRLGHSAKNTWTKLDESHRLRIDADESASHSAAYDQVQKKIMEFKGIHSQTEFLNSAMDEIKLAEDTQRSDKLADPSAIYVDGQTAQRDDVSST